MVVFTYIQVTGMGRDRCAFLLDREHISDRKSVVFLDVARLKRRAGSRRRRLCARACASCGPICTRTSALACPQVCLLNLSRRSNSRPPSAPAIIPSSARLPLAVTARWDTVRRLLFHTARFIEQMKTLCSFTLLCV